MVFLHNQFLGLNPAHYGYFLHNQFLGLNPAHYGDFH